MKVEVKILSYQQLSLDQREEWKRRCYGSFLEVRHNDTVILFQSDYMAPEDVSFYRDLNWIPKAIERAYKLGHADGIDEVYKGMVNLPKELP